MVSISNNILILTAVLILREVDFSTSECCGAMVDELKRCYPIDWANRWDEFGYSHVVPMCYDCHPGTPHCCGVGWCNIFCCNCDYGCRRWVEAPGCGRYSQCAPGSRMATTSSANSSQPQQQEVTRKRVNAVIKRLDLNGDGQLDMAEFFANQHPSLTVEHFREMDADKDGFIKKEEIDPDYK